MSTELSEKGRQLLVNHQLYLVSASETPVRQRICEKMWKLLRDSHCIHFCTSVAFEGKIRNFLVELMQPAKTLVFPPKLRGERP